MSHTCQFSSETDHGYKKVMVDYSIGLCEVGENCVEECEFAYTALDVKICPTCNGNPVNERQDGCKTCDVFGLVRITNAPQAGGELSRTNGTR